MAVIPWKKWFSQLFGKVDKPEELSPECLSQLMEEVARDFGFPTGHPTRVYAKALQDLLAELQIERLIHFTKSTNLPLIFRHGLLPGSVLEKAGIPYEKNDPARLDCPGYRPICFSLGFPNQSMLYRYAQALPDESAKYCVLELDAALLLETHAAFFEKNAAGIVRRHRKAEISQRLNQPKALQKTMEKSYWTFRGHPLPNNDQAEILLFGRVDPSWIRTICFETGPDQRAAMKAFKNADLARVDESYFQRREKACVEEP